MRSPEYYHSSSWSSNTKNFVVVESNKIKIFNWKKRNIEEISSIEKVERQLSTFYEYLTNNNFKTDRDIAPFILGIFKQIKDLTNESKEASNSLNLLFLLIATLENPEYQNIDYAKWGLNRDIYIPSGFERCINIFHSGISNEIKPNLDLVLRHSSGLIFQEAHREVIFSNRQFDLWGNLTSKQEVQKLMYSSIHYTPSYIARSIVEFVLSKIDLNKPNLKIFDPACGSSEFLLEIQKQLKSKDYKGTIKLIGWDSSELAVSTSLFLLTHQQNLWDKITVDIRHVEDSLREDWENDYDIIVMNPPFMSYELMKKNERESVVGTLSSQVSGRPNQASAFIYKAVQCLSPNGIIGCVTPSSIFSLDAYSKLRQSLDDILKVHLIAKLGNYVFEDALVDIGILVAEKSNEGNTIPIIAWAKNEKGVPTDVLRQVRKFENTSRTINTKAYSVYTPEKFPVRNDSWKPISFEESELIKKVERMAIGGSLSRVQDVFHVKLGIRTGNNNVFKVSNEYFKSLPSQERKFFRPVIDNDAINKGVIETKNYVWYPYSETDILIKNENDLKELASTYYTQILANKRTELINRSRKDESNWWLLSEPLSWLRKKYLRLISTEFGKSGSFAVDAEGKFLVERGNGWIPKKDFKHIDSNYFYLSIF